VAMINIPLFVELVFLSKTLCIENDVNLLRNQLNKNYTNLVIKIGK
jgi:hypothetical protein